MDTQDVFALIEKFDESSLAELKLKDGEFRIHLKKAGAEPTVIHHGHPAAHMHQFPVPTAHAPAPSAPATGAPATGAAAEPAGSESAGQAADSGLEVITSPIVGTFYRAPAPDSPPHAEEGDVIKTGAPLCIIEAMKVMNELEADFDMEIVRVLVENAEMVEFGTPLFEVRRT
ncbi:acetyl-CoA carboxylase biotin carboxyl carrier protein [Spirochaeta africana]|uniref:Biotin carboxyl carrier protein of acetyl-CoA carboxylase n=1 Tax=Spirochaeta africana (strain ATCC 700263 / DSM 8902 / Z-7692) TaxID=889378 RepID=H9UL57_SPIAZ|nr:acetyl-CoA carboxylase biotin carboxyl carrier protein [Spirochaeta africana]AFG38250.1 acetyl-CoA carboxylase, biotin carboxyl carrier protein [Spirochaeta africana DSM 8902]